MLLQEEGISPSSPVRERMEKAEIATRKHWNRLPKELVEPSSLDIFESY